MYSSMSFSNLSILFMSDYVSEIIICILDVKRGCWSGTLYEKFMKLKNVKNWRILTKSSKKWESGNINPVTNENGVRRAAYTGPKTKERKNGK